MRVQRMLGNDKGDVHDVLVHWHGFSNRARSAHRPIRLIRPGSALADVKNNKTKFYATYYHYRQNQSLLLLFQSGTLMNLRTCYKH
jgi:hypothetical protein